MKTAAITNQKGGVGKTAITTHLSFHLRDLGHRVLVIDLDNQGNASSTLAGVASGIPASKLFTGEKIAVEPRDGITLIEADMALADLERADPNVINAFRENVHRLSPSFDYAVIDTPPTLGLRMTAALIAANFALCPIELEGYSIQGITKMLQTIFGIQANYNPGLTFLGMLPNRFNAHSASQKANLDQLLASYAHLMITAKIGNRSSISDALGQGIPVWEMPKTAARDAGKEMKEALGQVINKMETQA